jgi:hypothetical protein
MSYSVSHQEALESGDLDRVNLDEVTQLLQDPSVDPTASDNEAIRRASGDGNLSVVNRLLQDERVDPSANDNISIRFAAYNAADEDDDDFIAVVERLLQDNRVDPSELHRLPNWHEPLPAKVYPAAILTDAMLPRLAAALSLPFRDTSCIILWQPRLREYRQEQMQFMETLIASWRWHRGGLCRDIVESIVSEYALGVKLFAFRAMDAEYVAPPPLLVDPTVAGGDEEDDDDDDGGEN